MGKRIVIGNAVVIAAQFAILACELSPTAPTEISTGVWGGDGARLTVAGTSATIQFDCAHGTLDDPISVDRDGHFDVAGTFLREHGGPVSDDDPLVKEPARYVGTIKDEKMTLTLTSYSRQIGPFTLVRGQQSRLVRCL